MSSASLLWFPACTGMTERAGHRIGLLAWYDEPISTAPLEGTNNKIKTMKRQAYGYREIKLFKLTKSRPCTRPSTL